MSLRKVQVVAVAEFLHLIRTWVFRLSLVLVPLFALGLSYLVKHYDAAGSPAGEAPQAIVAPMSMVLLFLIVMLTTPQMMSSVIEEKMSRISEILLSSLTAFELMMGKLLACAAVAALVAFFYGSLGLVLATHFGYAVLVTLKVVLSVAFFMTLAVFLHGSLYMAIGAACSQPKDAQGLLAPLVLLTTMPLFLLPALIREPSGGLSQLLSFFPLSAPFVMCFRVNATPGPSPEQLVLSIAISVLSTVFCVWAASRVFRVGLLSQGKAPDIRQLWRWVFTE